MNVYGYGLLIITVIIGRSLSDGFKKVTSKVDGFLGVRLGEMRITNTLH